MKRILLSLLGVVMFASLAWAGTNLRQNGDGTASWVSTDGTARKVGAVVLSAHLTDVSTLSTTAVVVPITNMKVTAIKTVLHAAITGADSILRVHANHYGAANTMAQITVAQSGSAIGDVDTATVSANNNVMENETIFIQTDGGSTNTGPMTILLYLEPRS